MPESVAGCMNLKQTLQNSYLQKSFDIFLYALICSSLCTIVTLESTWMFNSIVISKKFWKPELSLHMTQLFNSIHKFSQFTYFLFYISLQLGLGLVHELFICGFRTIILSNISIIIP